MGQKLTYKVPNFLGGINYSVSEELLKDNETNYASNVCIDDGKLSNVQGAVIAFANVVSGTVIKSLAKFYMTDETGNKKQYLFAITGDNRLFYYYTSWIYAMNLAGWNINYINYKKGNNDIIIITDGTNVIKFDGTTFSTLSGNPPKGNLITLHKERVWIAGDKLNPNRLYYSDDFDPENWATNENGTAGGAVDIETWDGGYIIGLSNIFSDVVVFKTKSIHRIHGTYPGDYEVIPIYSTVGAIAPKTIVSGADLAFFLSKEGLFYYDGVVTKPLQGDKLKGLDIDPSYEINAVSIIFKNKLYMAFPTKGSSLNNCVLEYDLIKQNFMLRYEYVSDFIEFNDRLYFTRNDGNIYEWNTGNPTSYAYYSIPTRDLGQIGTIKEIDTLMAYVKGSGGLYIDITPDDNTSLKQTFYIPLNTSIPMLIIRRFFMRCTRFNIVIRSDYGTVFSISSLELNMNLYDRMGG